MGAAILFQKSYVVSNVKPTLPPAIRGNIDQCVIVAFPCVPCRSFVCFIYTENNFIVIVMNDYYSLQVWFQHDHSNLHNSNALANAPSDWMTLKRDSIFCDLLLET